MKKADKSKPLYTPPKGFRLDENESVYGGDCFDGTGDSNCGPGNSADTCFPSGNDPAETFTLPYSLAGTSDV